MTLPEKFEPCVCKECNVGKIRPVQFSLEQAIVMCDNLKCDSYLNKLPWEGVVSNTLTESPDLYKYEKDSHSSGIQSDFGSSNLSDVSTTDREVRTFLNEAKQNSSDFHISKLSDGKKLLPDLNRIHSHGEVQRKENSCLEFSEMTNEFNLTTYKSNSEKLIKTFDEKKSNAEEFFNLLNEFNDVFSSPNKSKQKDLPLIDSIKKFSEESLSDCTFSNIKALDQQSVSIPSRVSAFCNPSFEKTKSEKISDKLSSPNSSGFGDCDSVVNGSAENHIKKMKQSLNMEKMLYQFSNGCEVSIQEAFSEAIHAQMNSVEKVSTSDLSHFPETKLERPKVELKEQSSCKFFGKSLNGFLGPASNTNKDINVAIEPVVPNNKCVESVTDENRTSQLNEDSSNHTLSSLSQDSGESNFCTSNHVSSLKYDQADFPFNDRENLNHAEFNLINNDSAHLNSVSQLEELNSTNCSSSEAQDNNNQIPLKPNLNSVILNSNLNLYSAQEYYISNDSNSGDIASSKNGAFSNDASNASSNAFKIADHNNLMLHHDNLMLNHDSMLSNDNPMLSTPEKLENGFQEPKTLENNCRYVKMLENGHEETNIFENICEYDKSKGLKNSQANFTEFTSQTVVNGINTEYQLENSSSSAFTKMELDPNTQNFDVMESMQQLESSQVIQSNGIIGSRNFVSQYAPHLSMQGSNADFAQNYSQNWHSSCNSSIVGQFSSRNSCESQLDSLYTYDSLNPRYSTESPLNSQFNSEQNSQFSSVENSYAQNFSSENTQNYESESTQVTQANGNSQILDGDFSILGYVNIETPFENFLNLNERSAILNGDKNYIDSNSNGNDDGKDCINSNSKTGDSFSGRTNFLNVLHSLNNSPKVNMSENSVISCDSMNTFNNCGEIGSEYMGENSVASVFEKSNDNSILISGEACKAKFTNDVCEKADKLSDDVYSSFSNYKSVKDNTVARPHSNLSCENVGRSKSVKDTLPTRCYSLSPKNVIEIENKSKSKGSLSNGFVKNISRELVMPFAQINKKSALRVMDDEEQQLRKIERRNRKQRLIMNFNETSKNIRNKNIQTCTKSLKKRQKISSENLQKEEGTEIASAGRRQMTRSLAKMNILDTESIRLNEVLLEIKISTKENKDQSKNKEMTTVNEKEIETTANELEIETTANEKEIETTANVIGIETTANGKVINTTANEKEIDLSKLFLDDSDMGDFYGFEQDLNERNDINMKISGKTNRKNGLTLDKHKSDKNKEQNHFDWESLLNFDSDDEDAQDFLGFENSTEITSERDPPEEKLEIGDKSSMCSGGDKTLVKNMNMGGRKLIETRKKMNGGRKLVETGKKVNVGGEKLGETGKSVNVGGEKLGETGKSVNVGGGKLVETEKNVILRSKKLVKTEKTVLEKNLVELSKIKKISVVNKSVGKSLVENARKIENNRDFLNFESEMNENDNFEKDVLHETGSSAIFNISPHETENFPHITEKFPHETENFSHITENFPHETENFVIPDALPDNVENYVVTEVLPHQLHAVINAFENRYVESSDCQSEKLYITKQTADSSISLIPDQNNTGNRSSPTILHHSREILNNYRKNDSSLYFVDNRGINAGTFENGFSVDSTNFETNFVENGHDYYPVEDIDIRLESEIDTNGTTIDNASLYRNSSSNFGKLQNFPNQSPRSAIELRNSTVPKIFTDKHMENSAVSELMNSISVSDIRETENLRVKKPIRTYSKPKKVVSSKVKKGCEKSDLIRNTYLKSTLLAQKYF